MPVEPGNGGEAPNQEGLLQADGPLLLQQNNNEQLEDLDVDR